MKYDVFTHGVGVTVYDKDTGQTGTVMEIKETAFEYIEPFVDFGDGFLKRCNQFNLVVIDEQTDVETER